MERWAGRVAVVTGASAGIGAEVSRTLVAAGMKVAGLARRLEKLQELAQQFQGLPGSFFPVLCDVSSEEQVLAAFVWLESNVGVVDVLVNNAGIAGLGSLLDGNPAEWRRMLDVNVLGLCLCTKEAVRSMRTRLLADGLVINISSYASTTVPHHPSSHFYSATKHALRALTDGLRQELADLNCPVRVTSISPGLVKTDMLSTTHNQEYSDAVYKSRPHLQPFDVAQAIVYVLSTPINVQVHDVLLKPMNEKL